MEYRCVHCGNRVKMLLVQYSHGNIRLMKCEKCKAVADEYIECDITILLIDLILHKPKAYRHLLYNVPHHHSVDVEGILWKSVFTYLLLDACRYLISNNGKEHFASSASSLSSIQACGKMLVEVLVGNVAFFGFLLFVVRFLLKSPSQVTRNKEFFLAILVSSYFKFFLIAMMVWEFPSSVLLIIDVFVLSSNALALTVLTQSTLTGCIGACIGAHAAKLAANCALEVLPLQLSRCFRILD